MLKRIMRAVRGRISRAAMRLRYRAQRQVRHRIARPERWRPTDSIVTDVATLPWLVRDERWTHIVRRWENRAVLARGGTLEFAEEPVLEVPGYARDAQGRIFADIPAHSHDEWLYLALDPAQHAWRDLSWVTRFRCETIFKELQFGFRYRDFYNRYRYRFQDGKLCFDVVRNGQFHADLSVHAFVLEPGREYTLEIRAMGSVFECWVDGERISVDFDPDGAFPTGSVMVVLWEDDGVTDMRATLETVSIRTLVEAPAASG